MIWAARVDLQICVIGVIFPFMIGTFVGALSGYIGGRFDNLCMRVIDIVLAFPFLVLMLAIIAILGRAQAASTLPWHWWAGCLMRG